MIYSFTNATVRSASDLLADLEACRQLRHVSHPEKQEIVAFFFGDIEHSLKENRVLSVTGTFFVHTRAAFEEAFSVHGYCCDICAEVTPVHETKLRYAADRALDNLDGYAKLMLCNTCSSRFGSFCQKNFQKENRVPFSHELEQMMLAFLAHEVGIEARRIMIGNPPRKRKNAEAVIRATGADRKSVTGRLDNPGNLTLDWNTQGDGAQVPEKVR